MEAASAADAGGYRSILKSGTKQLAIPNEKMKYIMKIVKSLQESELLPKGVPRKIENEAKE